MIINHVEINIFITRICFASYDLWVLFHQELSPTWFFTTCLHGCSASSYFQIFPSKGMYRHLYLWFYFYKISIIYICARFYRNFTNKNRKNRTFIHDKMSIFYFIHKNISIKSFFSIMIIIRLIVRYFSPSEIYLLGLGLGYDSGGFLFG